MDRRKPLAAGYHLQFEGGAACTIQKERARGGSCIVYEALYMANGEVCKPVRVKECFPVRLPLLREDSGKIVAREKDEGEFLQAKAAMRQSFRIESGLSRSDGLTNHISNTWDVYEANNTVYILSAYAEGEILSKYVPQSLKECVSIAKNTAAVIGKIHESGYLYLDCKPDNIFVLAGASSLVQLFDFNTLCPWPPQQKSRISAGFTKGFAALEQQLGQIEKLGPYTDVYGVAALLFYLLFGRAPDALDCREQARFCWEKMRFGAGSYRDKLFYTLEGFLRKNLSNSWKTRCQAMEEVVAKLSEIEALAAEWRTQQPGPVGKKLRLYTLLCAPGDEEEPFLEFAEDIFSDSESLPEKDVMELYDKAVFAYVSQRNWGEAYKKLEQAKKYVKRRHSPELWARWHYLCATYFDARLAGQYDAGSGDACLRALVGSLDKAIRCLKFSRGKACKVLLAEYLLSKAAVLVRSCPENRAEIKAGLCRAGKLLPYCREWKPSLIRDFYLVCGWYFTLSKPDPAYAAKAMEQASKVNKTLGLSDLETIDELLIPWGNMLLESGDYAGAAERIQEAFSLCAKHKGDAPYYRKEQELTGCMEDIQELQHASTNPE